MTLIIKGFFWFTNLFLIQCHENFVSHTFLPAQVFWYWSEYLLALNTLLFLYLLFSFLFVQLFENFSELEISPPKVNLAIWEASKAVSEEQDAIR